MSAAPANTRFDRRRLPPVEALHVLTLSVFAVAQPLFDLLGRNASFFVAHRASRADVVLFSIATVVVPAAVLLLARYLISFVSRSAAHVFHLVCLALLGALVLTPPVVRAWGLRWVPATALAIAIGVLVLSLYRRSGGVRRFLSLLGLAAIAFPALFLFASGARALVLRAAMPATKLASAQRTVGNDTPVMVVLFDELSISSIITPDGTIDESRYGNFAKLARTSTWYRDATTSGLRTDQAVPAILTGRRVPRRQVPSSFAYPENLFTLLSGTHDLHVHESVTQLCPPELCRPSAGGRSAGLGPLFTDAAVVYGHLVLPADVARDRLPPLGDRWGGFSRDPAAGVSAAEAGAGGDPVKAWLRSALLASKEQHDGEILRRFLKGVTPDAERPQLSYVHLQAPHPPWRYLPTGQVYPTGATTPGYRDFTWSGNQYLADEVLQRSLLQSKFADKLLGAVEDRLKAIDLWNETLLIVTSDHGATWEAGHSRRDLDGDQRAGLLGVPLFVKYPGQNDGKISTRNAETVDVVPTIAEVAGIDVPWETHGDSLRGDRERDAKIVFDGSRERRVEYSFNESRKRAAEIQALFGPGGGAHDLYAFGPDRALMGRSVDSFEISRGDADTRVRILDEAAYNEFDRAGPVIPALLRGRLSGEVPDDPQRVAVAINGVIGGVGETFTEDGDTQVSIVVWPELLSQHMGNRVELYYVRGSDRLEAVRS